MLQILRTKDVKIPERSGRNAGFDFFIPNDFKPYQLNPLENATIPSGIKVRLPKNHVLIAFNKSGIAVIHQLHVGACVVDENYTGEIHLDVHNLSNKPYKLEPGMKLMQFVLIYQEYHSIIEIKTEDELYTNFNVKERGKDGFGSTGIQ